MPAKNDPQFDAMLVLVQRLERNLNPIESWPIDELLGALNSKNSDLVKKAVAQLKKLGKSWVVAKARQGSSKYLILVDETIAAYEYAERNPGFSRTQWGVNKNPVVKFDTLFHERHAYSPWKGEELAEGDDWLLVPEEIRMLPHIARAAFADKVAAWTIDEYVVLDELSDKSLEDLKRHRRWGEIVRWLQQKGPEQEKAIADAKDKLYEPWKQSSRSFSSGVVRAPVQNPDMSRIPTSLTAGPMYIKLVDAMVLWLDIPGLKDVCFNIQNDNGRPLTIDDFGYNLSKRDFAREVLLWCGRRSRIHMLLSSLYKVNNSVDWIGEMAK